MTKFRLAGMLTAASVLMFVAVVHAQPGSGGNPPPLPEEAYTACSGKSQGDSCTAKVGDRTVTGTCDIPPSSTGGSRLACKPSGPPPQR
jgi:hypothetical protein